MIRVYSQFSGSRYYTYDPDGRPGVTIPENVWRDAPYAHSGPVLDEMYSELTPALAEELAKRFRTVVHAEATYGVSEAYWRLVAVEDGSIVQTTAGPIQLPNAAGTAQTVVLAGPVSKVCLPVEITLDLSKLTPPAPFAEQLELPTEPELPVGTVVQILDSWGNPIDSTEVVE